MQLINYKSFVMRKLVQDLLLAANVSSLSALSMAPGAAPNETVRHSGLTFIVMIDYTNRMSNPSVGTSTYFTSTISTL
jgi:hypothetical protein